MYVERRRGRAGGGGGGGGAERSGGKGDKTVVRLRSDGSCTIQVIDGYSFYSPRSIINDERTKEKKKGGKKERKKRKKERKKKTC